MISVLFLYTLYVGWWPLWSSWILPIHRIRETFVWYRRTSENDSNWWSVRTRATVNITGQLSRISNDCQYLGRTFPCSPLFSPLKKCRHFRTGCVCRRWRAGYPSLWKRSIFFSFYIFLRNKIGGRYFCACYTQNAYCTCLLSEETRGNRTFAPGLSRPIPALLFARASHRGGLKYHRYRPRYKQRAIQRTLCL